jgi:hypothetical protein
VAGKFGSSAGEVIADALVRAWAEGTSRVGEEHLFAALLASPDSDKPSTLHNVYYRHMGEGPEEGHTARSVPSHGSRRISLILTSALAEGCSCVPYEEFADTARVTTTAKPAVVTEPLSA